MATVVYTRISKDPEGNRAGVERQRKDCFAFAESQGWEVAEHFEDDDRSAYSGAPRPAYTRMLEGIRAGAIHRVVVWAMDRLYRKITELEEVISLAESGTVEVHAVMGGEFDLLTADGRRYARTIVVHAQGESEKMSERLQAKFAELAEEGLPNGGPRPFGYEDDKVTVREAEGTVIREAAKRILSGESLYAVTNDLNARGIAPAGGGKAWYTHTLKHVLTAPRIAGLREHRGEVVGDAVWPGIVDRPTWERLRARLAERGRRHGPRGKSVHRHLLTGLAVCDKCGEGLNGNTRQNGIRGYRCQGCYGIRILAEPLEDFVREALFTALETPALVDAIREASGDAEAAERLYEQILADEEAMIQLGEDYDDGLITRAEFLSRRGRIEDRIAEHRAALTREANGSVLGDLPADVAEAWGRWDTPRRRLLVEALLERIVVGPAPKPGPGFHRERLELVWRA